MPFQPVQKTSAYHSRFQTPFRRRREGKTDYYARNRLVTQALNKYNSKKYRLVVRFTNKDVIAQIITSEVDGDRVFCAAYGHELKNYGVTHGLTNWASAYTVGLLIARRVLKKLGMDEQYKGDEEHSGEYQLTEAVEDGPRPFKVFLDIGLARSSTGAKVFAVAKGASDGGLFVPHNPKRLPGYDIETEELDAETLQGYLNASHVSEYMAELQDDDEEAFKALFQGYIDDEIDADSLEDVFTEAREKIREDPEHKPTTKKSVEEYKKVNAKNKRAKLTKEQRREKIAEKIAEFKAQQE